jgi:hypothetical protein
MHMQNNNEATPRSLLTVSQFSERWPAWSEPALRNLILNAEPRMNSRGETIPGNSLGEAGAIVRVGRRVLIDESAFFVWIASQNRKQPAGAKRAHPQDAEDRATA